MQNKSYKIKPLNLKKYSGDFKMYNHTLNNLKLKSILSIFTMGIFIFLGFASIEENPKVDCNFYPRPITKSFQVTIDVVDRITGEPILDESLLLDIYIDEYEKIVDSNFECTTKIKNSRTKIVDLKSGKAVLILAMTFQSKDDYVNVHFKLTHDFYYFSEHSLILKDFHVTNQTKRIGILKKQVYP